MREKKPKNKLEANKQRICFVSNHTSKTGNSRLPKPRRGSSVKKPISVGIDPVSLF